MRICIQLIIINVFVLQLKGQTEYYTTLPYADLEELQIALPYIQYYGSDSALVVFGSNHTTDYNDPQIAMIHNMINAFKPTLILYEGDGIATEKTQQETIETYFEMGLTKFIADSLHIRSVNIEPDTKDKYNFLLTKYTADDVMLATLGLQITMLQITNENFETHFSPMIHDLVKEGLELTQKQQTIKYFNKLYKKQFGKTFSYENFDARDFQAKYNRTVYNEINQMANTYRDQYIIRLTQSYLDKNERIFLIEGGWHAIVCAPAYDVITQ